MRPNWPILTVCDLGIEEEVCGNSTEWQPLLKAVEIGAGWLGPLLYLAHPMFLDRL